MADATSDKVIGSGLSFGGIRTRVSAYVSDNSNDDYCYVYCYGALDSIAIQQYGYNVSLVCNGSSASYGEGSAYNTSNKSWKCEWEGAKSVKLYKSGSAYDITVYCTGHISGGDTWAAVTVTIPARTYHAHGTPTISSTTTTANYGESVNLSWAKSGTQGNANFDRFELWRGSSKLYSGSGVAFSVKPSDTTGAKGGTVTYKLKEIHEWYGSYPSKETSITLTVRSGVVTAYDSSGAKHTALVTAYDSSGNSHYVLITAYDSSGKPHSVV